MKQKRIRQCLARVAAAAVAAAILTVPVAMAGCKRPAAAESTATAENETSGETEAPQGPSAEETLASMTVGDASGMVEAKGRLYFKYGNVIRSIEKATGELKELRSFQEKEVNNTFWVYKNSLYFDTNLDEMESPSDLFSIHKLDLETGKEEHLADLVARPTAIYASEGLLYVCGSGMNFVYQLDEEGKTAGELSPGETIYGKLPKGCRELYGGILPYYVDHYGYMPVQNDTCLVIAQADGTDAREVSEVTNTSAAFFGADCFFVLFQDGNGNSQCWRYDVEDLKKTLLFESPEALQLLQYRDGYLYYAADSSSWVAGDKTFYRIAKAGGEPEPVARIKAEPGMAENISGWGNFFASEDGVYCQQIRDYGIYIGRTAYGASEETGLLEPALYQSPIRSLGHVEAETRSIPSEADENQTINIYAEKLVFDGEGEAVSRMNQTMEERQQAAFAYGEAMTKSPTGDASLLFEIGEITLLRDRYCSIEANGYEYSGGNHGMPFKEYFVFDRETGARLGLSDLTANSQEELQAMVGKAFRALAEETNFAFEAPEDLEHTVSDDVSFDSDFYLTEEGIVFYYPPYEIAAYSEGFPQVVIPYEKLKMKVDLGLN